MPWWRGTARLLTISTLTGVVLHLTVRDSIPLLATLYYALPLPIILFLGMARLFCSRVLHHSRSVAAWTAIVAAMSVWTVLSLGEWHESRDDPEAIRVVCWNTGQGKGNWKPAFAEAINRLQPDVVGLIEAGGEWSTVRRFFEEHCPGFEVTLLGGGLACLTRGTAGEGSVTSLAGGGTCGHISVNIRGQAVDLLLVDVHSSPLRFRAAPLKALAERAHQLEDRAVIILGDFNTPNNSVHLEALRTQHQHAFETAGQGYAGTWPIPLPVLNLDQMWTNQRVHPVGCRHEWTSVSDHRLVVADVTILPPD